MLSVTHILAPVDFSERSEAAAREAARLAELFQAELTLLHVEPSIQNETEEGLKTQLELSRQLEGQLKALALRTKRDAKTVLAQGDPVTRIEEYVENHDIDLVVVATHGLGGFRRYLLGSLTSKMLHDLDVPIVTGVHLADEDGFPLVADNIACALGLQDLEDCERILRWAGGLAKISGANLTVIHVPSKPDTGLFFAEDTLHAILANAERTIAQLLEKTGLAAAVDVRAGDPMEGVLQQVVEQRGNALVIGRTAQKGLFRVGHADGYALIRQASVPVFSV